MTATINIQVTALPDAEEWFANAAAWSNYWANLNGTVTLDAVATTLYVPVTVDGNVNDFNIDGVDYQVPSIGLFLALRDSFNALNTSYENLRSELRDAGLITNAQ